MEWWQIALIVIVAIAGGALVGVLLSYLVGRFAKKPEAASVVDRQQESTAADFIAEVKNNASHLVGRLVKKPGGTSVARAKRQDELAAKEVAKGEAEEAKRAKEAVVEEQLTSAATGLLEEVENNHRIATEPLADRLIPFQTDAWDARKYEMDKLPANLRDELEQVYTDIRLANSIVWVSTEFNRRTPSLDENYRRLCTSIAERLNKIKPLIKQLEE